MVNPYYRKIKGKTFVLSGSGLKKKPAIEIATFFRNRGNKARLFRDPMWKFPRWCVYVEEK